MALHSAHDNSESLNEYKQGLRGTILEGKTTTYLNTIQGSVVTTLLEAVLNQVWETSKKIKHFFTISTSYNSNLLGSFPVVVVSDLLFPTFLN